MTQGNLARVSQVEKTLMPHNEETLRHNRDQVQLKNFKNNNTASTETPGLLHHNTFGFGKPYPGAPSTSLLLRQKPRKHL